MKYWVNFGVAPRRNLPLRGKCQIYCHLGSFSLSKACLSCDFGLNLFADVSYLYMRSHDYHQILLCRGDVDYNEGEMSVIPPEVTSSFPHSHLQRISGETLGFLGFLCHLSGCMQASNCSSLWKQNSCNQVELQVLVKQGEQTFW